MLSFLSSKTSINNFLMLYSYSQCNATDDCEFMCNVSKFKMSYNFEDYNVLRQIIAQLNISNPYNISGNSVDHILLWFSNLKDLSVNRVILICQSILCGISSANLDIVYQIYSISLIKKQMHMEALSMIGHIKDSKLIGEVLLQLIFATQLKSVDYMLSNWINPHIRKDFKKVLKSHIMAQNNSANGIIDLHSDFGAILFKLYEMEGSYENAVKVAFTRIEYYHAILYQDKEAAPLRKASKLSIQLKLYHLAERAIKKCKYPIIHYLVESDYQHRKRRINEMGNDDVNDECPDFIEITAEYIKTKMMLTE